MREFSRPEPPKERDKPADVTLDTAELKQLNYMYRLKDKIESIWIYPPVALNEGITGDLLIRFVIRQDGSLGEVTLVRTSGHPLLDEAALEAVRNAAPFLPLPKQWDSNRLAIMGHFYYLLNEMYIR